MTPVAHYFPRRKVARLALAALRNEATACDALQRYADADTLRAEANRLERKLLAVAPFPYTPARVEVVIAPDPIALAQASGAL